MLVNVFNLDFNNETDGFEPNQFLHDNSLLDGIVEQTNAATHGENSFGSMEEAREIPSVRIKKS